MGSPLSPAVMNLFMEIFEKRTSESVVLRLKLWVRYMDDTIVLYCGHMKRTNWRLPSASQLTAAVDPVYNGEGE